VSSSPYVRKAQRQARSAYVGAVVVPVFAALITAAATVAAAAMSRSTSPSSSTPSLGSTSECAIYEEGFLVPLARINYKIVAPFLNSHSSINYICGLIPSPSPPPPSPSPAQTITIVPPPPPPPSFVVPTTFSPSISSSPSIP